MDFLAIKESHTAEVAMLLESGTSVEQNIHFSVQLWYSWVTAGHTSCICPIL